MQASILSGPSSSRLQRCSCSQRRRQGSSSSAAAAAAPAAGRLAATQQRRQPSTSSSSARRGRHSRAAVAVRAMFTGIVQGMATVAAVTEAEALRTFRIRLPEGRAANIQIGASVAINGTCLTVTAIDGDELAFDVMGETLRATSLGGLKAGDAVNYERSARVGDEIGGHTVSGHVHTTATVRAVEDSPNNRRVVFELPVSGRRWAKYILPKGFVAVDGCSLTVGEVTGGSAAAADDAADGDDAPLPTFSVYLIPETMRVTVFGQRSVGDSVNIEVEAQTQAIVDTVERVVAQRLEALGLGGGDAAASVKAAVAAAAGAGKS